MCKAMSRHRDIAFILQQKCFETRGREVVATIVRGFVRRGSSACDHPNRLEAQQGQLLIVKKYAMQNATQASINVNKSDKR